MNKYLLCLFLPSSLIWLLRSVSPSIREVVICAVRASEFLCVVVPLSMAKESKVILKSSDDHLLEVDESVAFQSQTIKNMIEDTGTECAIPLPDVSSKILAKVIEYCQYHVDAQKANDGNSAISEDDVKNWDADFVKVDQATLFDLVLAADYLNIKNLLVLTCQTVEDMTKSKTAEEIHKMLTEWASEPKMSDLDI